MRWPDNRLCDLLGLEHPIIQAPMAGATTPEMVAAASNAGALGSHGCAMFSTDRLKEEIERIKALSDRPYNLNFFVHPPPVHDPAKAESARARLKPWYERLDAGDIPEAVEKHFPFDQAACDIVCKAAPKAVSFHFGLPEPAVMQRLKKAGIVILSSATSAAEAKWLEERGADAVIAQGYEAGGHSGWFLPRNGADLTGTMALVPRIVDAVSVPVVAAGGIADGRGIAAALMLGAAGVQIGTAFLRAPESAAGDTHKKMLAKASGDDTMLSTAFSGRHARTLVNAYARDMADACEWPDFPIMNTLSGPLRKASAAQDAPDAIALWSGQAIGLCRDGATASIIETLVSETEAVLMNAFK